MKIILIFILSFLCHSSSLAGEADVLAVDVKKNSGNTYNFSVTVAHNDANWDHFANKWEIIAIDETILATRVLQHPHVNEQPFTRSLSGVKLPDGTESVTIRAHDSVHKYGGKVVTVKLPKK
ncbi:MAG: hypothetical protein JKY19_01200 [Alcanivoracaceae bacterium]|nr:hypothetical protein [Alcanivoracaceae bacterium]